jgi:protein TIF31
LTPLDINFIEEHFSTTEKNGYPHRMVFLRGECVDAFWENKLHTWISNKLSERNKDAVINEANTEAGSPEAREKPEDKLETQDEKNTQDRKDAEDDNETQDEIDNEAEKIDLSRFDFALNPDVFTPCQAPVTEEEKKRVAEDEQDVRDCCAFLREKLIPNLMRELADGAGGWPVDGKSLTNTMHRNGVNVRYIGKVIELCADSPKLQAVKVCQSEYLSDYSLSRLMKWRPELRNMSFLDICEDYLY